MGGGTAGTGNDGVGDLFEHLTQGELPASAKSPGQEQTGADFHALR
jgi:hypothetical protein